MNARNSRQNRTAPDVVVSSSNHPQEEQLSTRVLLDSASPLECHGCTRPIEHGTRYKCLTVHDEAGVRELLFCDEECLAEHRQ